MSRNESKTVYYASIGPELTLYDIDVDGAALIKRGAVTLPANIQYVWPHPSRRTLYAVSSNGGPQVTGDTHRANALTIDQATGALQLHGAPAALPSRPIHCSVDASGAYLLTRTTIRATSPCIASMPTARSARRLHKAGKTRCRHLCASNPRHAVERHGAAGDPRQRRQSGQAGGSRRDQDVRFRQRRADRSCLDRARHRARLRAAPSRFSSDEAVGVRLDRAAEQALCLQARCRHRPRARADVRQGHAGRSEPESAPGRRSDSRPSERQIRLSDQSRLGPGGCERHESVHGGRK